MTQAPYGGWSSPITPDRIAISSIRLGQLCLDGDTLYWTESRPAERGRSVLMRRYHGQNQEVLPPPFHVRSAVHEYGGGAFSVAGSQIYWVHFPDQRLYHWDPQTEKAQPLTPMGCRYADGFWDDRHHRWIGVREDHRDADREPINTLVSVAGNGDDQTTGGTVLHSGHDFYSSPRLSPDGQWLAWLTWDHPQMPWDGTTLWVAAVLADGTLGSLHAVAGNPTESIQQPLWANNGWLYFISDRSGWWNLYRCQGCWQGELMELHDETLWPLEAEFAGPPWSLGQSSYALLSDQTLICTFSQQGVSYLARLDVEGKAGTVIETPYTAIDSLYGCGDHVYFVGGAADRPSAVVAWSLSTGEAQVWQQSSSLSIAADYCSWPQAIEFPTGGGKTAFGFYYPPHNQEYEGIPGERPPLLVKTHGGPTGATSTVLNWGIQFWTSRGFAVLDVNYGGSTGYGRAYRQRLEGQWGIVDVEDAVHGALYLVQQGWVDGQRLAINGGSAGGYTTLAALTFYDVFRAGASYYGIGDLTALAQDTHKFESRYLDGLIGPYPAEADLYRQRSPLFHTEQLSCPVIFFQGLEDKVVPPNQAEAMVAALREKGIPVAYLAFPDEQHGFRQATTIQRCLEAELYFYSRTLGFPLADIIDPVAIDHL